MSERNERLKLVERIEAEVKADLVSLIEMSQDHISATFGIKILRDKNLVINASFLASKIVKLVEARIAVDKE